ncbi:hypothetical protein D3C84_1258090 [compost metagenome]
MKAIANEFKASADKVRQEQQQQYLYKQQVQFDKQNLGANKNVRRNVVKSYLGDGRS